jgi:hypothetical protein
VFVNHPNQGCFLPSLPQLMVLCFRPCSGALGISQRALAAQLLQLAAGGQQVHVPGSRMHLAAEQQGMGEHMLLAQLQVAGCNSNRPRQLQGTLSQPCVAATATG